jgi:hypothetical protein
MKFITELAHGRQAAVSTLRLWLVFLAGAAVAALLIAALQRASATLSRPTAPTLATAASATPDRPAMPRTAFAPTFATAAESLRAGRYAEAYGRFVTLADEGDVDAARIALVMHRFGPDVFGSAWDASVEQLAEWTRWSEAAAQEELRTVAHGSGAAAGADGQLAPVAAVSRSR